MCPFCSETTHSLCKLERLKSSPLLPIRSTVQRLNAHASSSMVYKTATVRADDFKKVMEQKKIEFDVQICNAKRELIGRNRKRLRSIIDAIIL